MHRLPLLIFSPSATLPLINEKFGYRHGMAMAYMGMVSRVHGTARDGPGTAWHCTGMDMVLIRLLQLALVAFYTGTGIGTEHRSGPGGSFCCPGSPRFNRMELVGGYLIVDRRVGKVRYLP